MKFNIGSLSVYGWPGNDLKPQWGSPSVCSVTDAAVWLSEPAGLLLCVRWCPNALSQGLTHSSHALKPICHRSLGQCNNFNYLPEVMMCVRECFTDHTIKIWPVYFCLNLLYLAVSQQIGCWWLNLGSLASSLQQSPDHADAPYLRPLWTLGQLSVDEKTSKLIAVSVFIPLLCVNIIVQVGFSPCSVNPPAVPYTICLFHQYFFSVPPLSSQNRSLWGKKSLISPFACKPVWFYGIMTNIFNSSGTFSPH